MDCIFCKLINRDFPVNPVFENEDIIVLNDINPKAKIHMLIIPKKHIETINSLEDTDSVLVWKLFLVARYLAKERWIDWYKLQFNVWKWWWQEVFHIHLHFLAN